MATVRRRNSRQASFRFSDDDFALIDAIQAHHGLTTRTETLRFVMHAHARAEGVTLPSSKKKKKTLQP